VKVGQKGEETNLGKKKGEKKVWHDGGKNEEKQPWHYSEGGDWLLSEGFPNTWHSKGQGGGEGTP